jgi:hypothetical protein
MKKLVLLMLVSTIVFGCARKVVQTAPSAIEPSDKAGTANKPRIETPPSPPASENVTDQPKKFDMTLINTGQKVFESSCGRCHELKPPANYTQERWVKLVDWMAPKAKLTDKEKEQCLAYVQYNAKDAPKDKSKM